MSVSNSLDKPITNPARKQAQIAIGIFDQDFRVSQYTPAFRNHLNGSTTDPAGQLLETLFPALKNINLSQIAREVDCYDFYPDNIQLQFTFFYSRTEELTGGTLQLQETINQPQNKQPHPTTPLVNLHAPNLPFSKEYAQTAFDLEVLNNQLREEIKQHKLANEALLQARTQLTAYETRLNLALQAGHIGIWEWNFADDTLSWDGYKPEIPGFEQSNFICNYQDFKNLIYPADQSRVEAAIDQAIRNKAALIINFRVVTDTNSVLHIHSRGLVICNPEGQPIKMSGVSMDVTAQAETDGQLKETRFFLQQVADAIPDTLYLFDLKEKQTLFTNRSIADTLGYTPQDLNHMGASLIQMILHGEDQKMIAKWEERLQLAQVNEVVETEYRIKHKDGDWRWIYTREKIFKRDAQGNPIQIIGLAQDITGKKAALQELKSKTRLLNGIVAHLPIALWRVDKEGKIRQAMGMGLQSLGFEQHTIKGENFFQLFPELTDDLNRVLAGETHSFLVESRNKENKIYKQNYYYFDAESQQAVGFCLDVTQLKRVQDLLKNQVDFTLNLIDNSIDGIFAFDQDGRFTAWNRVMEQRYPLRREQVLGKTLEEGAAALGLFEEVEVYYQVLRGKTIRYRNKASRFWDGYLDVIVLPMFNQEQMVTGGIAFLHDVTERVNLEQERTRLKLRRQKEILNAILDTQEEERRRIAESLHNGVGQILYATKLSLEALLHQFELINPEAKDLSKQISGLLEEAINETRAVSFELVPVILRDFGLERALFDLKQRLAKARFNLYFNFTGLEKPLKKLYETAIYRIIQELLNNVIKHAKATEVHVHLAREGRKVMITVEDNGQGFNYSDPQLIYNGIGLSSIRNRIKLLNGTLNIKSQPGKGTIVEIDLKIT